jgi:hypothetical protein
MERWKEIVGWEGLYEVSDFGRVRSCDRIVQHAKNGPTLYRGRVLNTQRQSIKYRVVALSRPGKKPVCYNVHTLVLTMFVGPAPEGLECCHGPGGRHDNCLDNLRWDTRQANADDRVRDRALRSVA